MVLLYIVLLALLFLIIKDVTQGFRLNLSACLDRDCADVSVKYLYPMVHAVARLEQGIPFLSVSLFGKEVYKTRLIQQGKRKGAIDGLRMLRALEYGRVAASARYGLRDPFATGLVYGGLSLAAAYLNMEDMDIAADFLADEPYFNMDAHLNLNIGHTILNYARNK